MDTGIRVSIGAGLGAFVLSAVTALFSRIPFGIMLLRAFILGLLFAVLAFGLTVLLRRLLPELFESNPDADMVVASDSRPGTADSGNVVNIVLPGGDEVPVDAEPVDSGYAHGSEHLEAVQLGAETDVLPLSAAPLSRASVRDGEPDVAELTREVGQIRQSGLVQEPQISQASVSKTNGGIPRPRVSVDDLDVLPDLDSLSDSFIQPAAGVFDAPGSPDDSDVSYSSGSFSGGASSSKDGGDPVVIAKAVQTLLRRDQKGQ